MRNQQNSRMKNRMFLIKAGHYICTLLLFYGAWLLFRYNEFPQVRETGYRYNYFVEIAFGIVVAFFFRIYNAYLFGYFRIRTLMLAQFISQFFSVWIIYFGVSIGWNKFQICHLMRLLHRILCTWAAHIIHVTRWFSHLYLTIAYRKQGQRQKEKQEAFSHLLFQKPTHQGLFMCLMVDAKFGHVGTYPLADIDIDKGRHIATWQGFHHLLQFFLCLNSMTNIAIATRLCHTCQVNQLPCRLLASNGFVHTIVQNDMDKI